jgi:cell division protein FtsB
MASMQIAGNNLNGTAPVNDWKEHGYPAMAAALGTIGFPVAQWKLTLRDCHYTPGRTPAQPVQLVGVRPEQGRLSLKVAAPGGRYRFDVDLTPVNGRPAPEEFRRLENLFALLPDSRADADPGPAPAKAPAPAALSAADRLGKLQANLGKLLEYQRDHEAGEHLRAEVSTRLAATRARMKPLADTITAKEAEIERLEGEVRTTQQTIANMEARVADLRSGLVAKEAALRDAAQAARTAHGQYGPLRDESRQLGDRLAELDKEQAERTRAMGEAEKVEHLLKALLNLG